ncbi:MAG TPA: cyclic nucleotide-binding domain-containing protein [Gaiellaceae bacterium]|jgi:CRP-like cAMP-binding protein|nr:cyclic nucleotide-binding domain-containing protein [Gaiellaceae bacterium]
MLIVVAAWVAALLVFSSFFMKTMIPLRFVAIASNVAFVSYALLGLKYGIFGRVYPILVLHSSLLPLNVLRLRQIKSLINAVNSASESETLDYLIPYMRSERHSRGETLFSKGDAADKLYLIEEGSIFFPEVGKRLSSGAVFGEVGLFAPQSVRSLSAVCEEDCRLHAITKDTVLELYYQNPRFGFFLIRMVSALV